MSDNILLKVAEMVLNVCLILMDFCEISPDAIQAVAVYYSLITAAIPGDTTAIPGHSGRSPVPPMTHDPQLVCLLAHAASLSLRPTNFRGLVLGCIEAKFCK